MPENPSIISKINTALIIIALVIGIYYPNTRIAPFFFSYSLVSLLIPLIPTNIDRPLNGKMEKLFGMAPRILSRLSNKLFIFSVIGFIGYFLSWIPVVRDIDQVPYALTSKIRIENHLIIPLSFFLAMAILFFGKRAIFFDSTINRRRRDLYVYEYAPPIDHQQAEMDFQHYRSRIDKYLMLVLAGFVSAMIASLLISSTCTLSWANWQNYFGIGAGILLNIFDN